MTTFDKAVPIEAPEFLQMVRDQGPITQQDAETYVQSLAPENQEAVNGCYVIHCKRPCSFPIACAYNLSCGECLWPGISTIPFGCCFILTMGRNGYYVNPKGDTMVVKVDEEKETLVCFTKGCGPPCVYCEKC